MERTARRTTVWLLLIPALAFYLAFVVLPIVQSFHVSFFDWPTPEPRPTRFVGLDNYRKLLGDDIFWKALGHNVLLVVLSLVIQLPIALFLAVLLSGRVFARAFFRTVYFTPMILPSVVIAILWSQIYATAAYQGLLVRLLDALNLPFPESGFLGEPNVALIAIIATISWRYVGFHMVLFLAGIETIDERLYEAARVDGANGWQLFRHITLPSLTPVIRISAVLSIVGSLKYFDLVYIMTGGGPPVSATELLTTYMFNQGIRSTRGGYASAVAVAGFVISLLVVVVVMSLRKREPALVEVTP